MSDTSGLRAKAIAILRIGADAGDASFRHALKIMQAENGPSERQRVADALAASLGGRPAIDDTKALESVARIGGSHAIGTVARHLATTDSARAALERRLRRKRAQIRT